MVILATFFALAAFGAVPPNAELGTKALQSLRECKPQTASFFARELDRYDSQLGILYRGTWLQQKWHAAEKIEGNGLLWPWEGEIWRDEMISSLEGCNQESPLVFSEKNEKLLSEFFSSKTDLLGDVRTPFRRAWASYLLFRWQKEKSLPPIDQKMVEALPLHDYCDWAGLRLLAQKNSDAKDYFSRCKDEKGFLQMVLNVSYGDAALKNEEPERAWNFYTKALNHEPRPKDPSLWYRVALAAFQAHHEDDLAFRAAHYVSEADESFPPLFKSVLRDLSCERWEALSPEHALLILNRLFPSKRVVEEGLKELRECHGPHLELVFLKLQKKATTLREKVKLLSLLLRSSLSRGDLASARRHTAELARASRNSIDAKYAFWNAVRFKPNEVVTLARVFRASGSWSSADEDRLRSLERNQTKTAILKGLKVEERNEKGEFDLSLTELPPLSLREEISFDFGGAFREDLKTWLSR